MARRWGDGASIEGVGSRSVCFAIVLPPFDRVKKLGLKYDAAVGILLLGRNLDAEPPWQPIKQYRNSFHSHDPGVHLQPSYQPNIPQVQPRTPAPLLSLTLWIH